MGLDVYFKMPEGVALPERDFPGVCGWTGKEYLLHKVTLNPKYPAEGIISASSWLDTLCEYEEHTLEGNEVTFTEPVLDSIGQWEDIENAYPVHTTRREWANFRGGRYVALIYLLTGIDLHNESCSPEQVKLIAYALGNTKYNCDWYSPRHKQSV
jgi:hypothetical protein